GGSPRAGMSAGIPGLDRLEPRARARRPGGAAGPGAVPIQPSARRSEIRTAVGRADDPLAHQALRLGPRDADMRLRRYGLPSRAILRDAAGSPVAAQALVFRRVAVRGGERGGDAAAAPRGPGSVGCLRIEDVADARADGVLHGRPVLAVRGGPRAALLRID